MFDILNFVLRRQPPPIVITPPSKIRLFFVVICANISSYALGTCLSWTSPMIPNLRDKFDDSPLDHTLSDLEEGLIFCLIAVGAIFGEFIAGRMADLCGRIPALTVASFIYIIGYSLMIVGGDIEVIYTARIVQVPFDKEGIAGSFTITVIPIYIDEISTQESRVQARKIMMLFMTLGMLSDLCIGPFTSYILFQECCLAVPVISLAGFLYIPESPHYLVRKGNIPRAIKSLERIRGQSSEIVKNEIPAIQEAERAKALIKTTFSDIMCNRANRRATMLAIGLMACHHFPGAVVIIVNSQTIFIQAESNIDPAICSIIVASVQAFSSYSLSFIIDWWKRRTVLTISAIGVGLAQFTIGTYFFMDTKGYVSQLRWIPLVGFINFQIAFRLGLGPLPFAMLSELCGPNIIGIVRPCARTACWSIGFIIGLFYPTLEVYGRQYIFWGFAVLSMIALLFVRFVLIETHGLSFNEIQERLQK